MFGGQRLPENFLQVNKLSKEAEEMGRKYLFPQRLKALDTRLLNNEEVVHTAMEFIKKYEENEDPKEIKDEFSITLNRGAIMPIILELSKHGPELYEILKDVPRMSLSDPTPEELENKKKENEILEQINSERYAQNPQKEGADIIYCGGELEECVQKLAEYDAKGESVFIDFNGHLLYSCDKLTLEQAQQKVNEEKPDSLLVEEKMQEPKEQMHGIDEIEEVVSDRTIVEANKTTDETKNLIELQQGKDEQEQDGQEIE